MFIILIAEFKSEFCETNPISDATGVASVLAQTVEPLRELPLIHIAL